jgi:two-component system response regulator DevR
MPEIRVMLVDDHEIVRNGLRAILERGGHLRVVAEAGSVAEALSEAERVKPDVIVMDVRLPDGTGIAACRDIRAAHPEVRVLMLTNDGGDDAVYAAIVAGASGYVLKQTRGQAVLEAIQAVARGESLLDPGVTEAVLVRMRELAAGHNRDTLSSLSAQERRILGLIAAGQTNREIGLEMYLSEKTVKNYVSAILHKVGLERRTQAAAFLADQHDRDLA